MLPDKITPYDFLTKTLRFELQEEALLPYTSLKVQWFTSPQFPAKVVYSVRGDRESEIASLFFKIPQDCFLLVGFSVRIKEFGKITELCLTKLPELLALKKVIDLARILQEEEKLREISKLDLIDPKFHSLLKAFDTPNMTPQLRVDKEWQFLIVHYKPSSQAHRADLTAQKRFPITICLKAPVSSDELDSSFYKYALDHSYYFRAHPSDVYPLVLFSWYYKRTIPVKWDVSYDGKTVNWTYRTYFSTDTLLATTSFEKMLDANFAYQPAYFRAFIPSMVT